MKNLTFIFLLFFFLLINLKLKAQSLVGGTGLITIPTAFTPPDGQISIGSFYIDKKYLEYSKKEHDAIVGYVNLTYLPFLEVNFRLVRILALNSNTYTVDRVPSLRLHILKEQKYLPAICLGAHDFIWVTGGINTIFFNSLYIVGSKSFNFNSYVQKIDLNLGYSSTIMQAEYYQYKGFFAGTSCTVNDYLKVMLEYDSRRFNIGTQINLFKHFNLTAGLLGFDSFSGGFNFYFNL